MQERLTGGVNGGGRAAGIGRERVVSSVGFVDDCNGALDSEVSTKYHIINQTIINVFVLLPRKSLW